MKKVVLSLSVMALLETACKKDVDTPEAITPTKENLTGSYLLSKITAQTANAPEYPVTNYMDSCQRDDIFKLNADYTYQVVDAGMQCGGNYSDTWSLVNASTIVLEGDTYTIRRFDGKTLELTEDYNGSTLITYFSKQ